MVGLFSTITWAADGVPGGFVRHSIDVNGVPRQFYIHVPAGAQDSNRPLPVIMAFHGGGGTGKVMTRHWRRHRNQGKVIVCPTALPEAGKNLWQHANPGRIQFDPRDVEFVKELVRQLTSRDWIDPTRIYATGFSNGAGFTWQLMVGPSTSKLFRGYGVVSQALAAEKQLIAKPAGPLPVIYIHGTAEDSWMNVEDFADRNPHDSVRWLLDHNQNDVLEVQEGCYPDLGGKPYEVNGVLQRDRTIVVRQHYPANSELPDGGAAVTFLAAVGGGHSWPRYIDPPEAGFHCRDIDAADEIVRFWQEHAGL